MYTSINGDLYPVYMYKEDDDKNITYLYYAQYEDGNFYWFFDNDITKLSKQKNSPYR
jgi:hypothetical protein